MSLARCVGWARVWVVRVLNCYCLMPARVRARLRGSQPPRDGAAAAAAPTTNALRPPPCSEGPETRPTLLTLI